MGRGAAAVLCIICTLKIERDNAMEEEKEGLEPSFYRAWSRDFLDS